jgi:hypothetical protein
MIQPATLTEQKATGGQKKLPPTLTLTFSTLAMMLLLGSRQ